MPRTVFASRGIARSLFLASALLLSSGIRTAAQKSSVTPAAMSAPVQKLIDAGHTLQRSVPPRAEAAEQRYQEALQVARGRQDRVGEGAALRNLGNIAYLRKDVAKARDLYSQSASVCEQAHDLRGLGDSLYNTATTHSATDPATALQFGERARQAYHDAGDVKNEGQTISFLARVSDISGHKEHVAEQYKQAIEMARSVGDAKGEADALWYLATRTWIDGNEYSVKRAQLPVARSLFERSAALYHKVGDFSDEAWTDQLLGGIWIEAGDISQGRRYYEQSLALYRRVRDPAQVPLLLSELSNLSAIQERLLDSMRYGQEALALYTKSGNTAGRAAELRHLGDIYARFGQQRTALQAYLQSLPLVEKAGTTDDQVTTLNGIGEIYDILGDHKSAVAYYERCIPLLEKPANPLARQHNIGILAAIYQQTGQPKKARVLLVQQLSSFRASGYTSLIPTTLSLLAMIERQLGHTTEALGHYREALTLLDSFKDNLATAGTLDSVAEIEQEQGQLDQAEEHFRGAVAVLEKVRGSLGGLSEAKSTLLNANIGIYRNYLSLLLERGKKEEAFKLVQKIKARTLLDILYGGKVDLGGSLTPEERSQEHRLRDKCDVLNSRLVKEGVQNEIGSRKRAEAIQAELSDAERDLQVYEDGLYTRHPGLAQKRGAATIGLNDVAEFLPEDTALLEYATLRTGSKDQVLLFVTTRRGQSASLAVHAIPIKAEELAAKVAAMRLACSDPRKPYGESAAELYSALVAPAEAEIAGKSRLIVCPDGALWDVPFAALVQGGEAVAGKPAALPQFLINRFEIDYAYSATGADATAKARVRSPARGERRTMLAFANPAFGDETRFGDNPDLPGQRPIGAPSRPIGAPSRTSDKPTRPIGAPSRPIGAPSRDSDTPSRPIGAPSRDLLIPRGGRLTPLPGTALEAAAIKADFPDARVLTGARAQESVAKLEAGHYRYIHFATHGFFNDGAPLLSAIVLAAPNSPGEDGFLTAREVFDLRLNADMVVLSACNTARGEKRSGEGIVGLTWALFAAGAPTQVVSQWAVNDASTAQLMKRFYCNLSQQKLQKGAALRNAALSLMHSAPASGGDLGSWSHPYYWAPFILMGDWR